MKITSNNTYKSSNLKFVTFEGRSFDNVITCVHIEFPNLLQELNTEVLPVYYYNTEFGRKIPAFCIKCLNIEDFCKKMSYIYDTLSSEGLNEDASEIAKTLNSVIRKSVASKFEFENKSVIVLIDPHYNYNERCCIWNLNQLISEVVNDNLNLSKTVNSLMNAYSELSKLYENS